MTNFCVSRILEFITAYLYDFYLDESEMNRTFEVDENSVNHTLNTTFEINDTPSKSVQNAVREPLKDISGINTILLDNLELDEISHNLSSISVKSIQNTSINKNQCLIDKTFPEFVDTYLPTPLIDKIPKAVNKTPKKDNSCRDNSITNTPRVTKMSDTFITDMLAEDVLLDSPVKKTAENVADKLAHKQEISVSKCSEIRQKDSSNFQKSIFRNSFISKVPKYKETPDKHRCFFSKSPTYNHADSSYKSKLPKIKKTPVKFKHFIRSPVNSPVSDYIHLGKKIQSSSEARHSKCLKNQLQEKSKTDRKGSKQSSMIPQSTLGAAKRKLDLEVS